jgi:Tol biopolymer transport system component
VLFVSDRNKDNNDIWRIGVNGTGLRRLTTSQDDDGSPVWSPDGRTIAYSSYHFASYDLYTMRADGSGKKSIAKDLSDDVQPQISPDGRSIVFVRTCQTPELCMKHSAYNRDAAGELYLMSAAGGRQRRLRRTFSAAESDPRWAPNGTSIAFVSTLGSNSDIYTIRPDGSGLRRLTRSPAADLDPQWSPDGSRIAFTSVRDGNAEVYVMNADGSGQRNLTRNPADDSTPRWSPDGKRIFFVSSRDGGDLRPLVMASNGSGPKSLAEITPAYADLAVAPQGLKKARTDRRRIEWRRPKDAGALLGRSA